MKHVPNAGAARFLEHMERARELRREVVSSDGLTPQQEALSRWQTARLSSTYADFSKHKRFRPAIKFFLEDLYGTKDFTQRDTDIERVYPIMARVLSENAMHSLSLAVELHALTQQLDSDMIAVLTERIVVRDVGRLAGIEVVARLASGQVAAVDGHHAEPVLLGLLT